MQTLSPRISHHLNQLYLDRDQLQKMLPQCSPSLPYPKTNSSLSLKHKLLLCLLNRSLACQKRPITPRLFLLNQISEPLGNPPKAPRSLVTCSPKLHLNLLLPLLKQNLHSFQLHRPKTVSAKRTTNKRDRPSKCPRTL